MAAATDREREIDMRMNDKLSIGTGRDREAAPDIRTEVRTDTIRAYLKKKLRSDQILSDKIDEKYLSDAMGRRKAQQLSSYFRSRPRRLVLLCVLHGRMNCRSHRGEQEQT